MCKVSLASCPLYKAVENNDELQVINLLNEPLPHITDIDNLSGTSCYDVSFEKALKTNRKEIVRLMIKNPKINVYQRTKSIFMLFEDEVVLKYEKFVIELLKNQMIDWNQKNSSGRTLFHFAAKKGYAEVVSWLLKKGADAHEYCKCNTTPLILAAVSEHKDIVSLCIEYSKKDSDKRMESIWELLSNKVPVGYENEVYALLKQDCCDVNFENYKGQTLLLMATKKGYIRVVSLLLEYGADIYKKSKKEGTPFDVAAKCGYREMVRLFIEHSALSVEQYAENILSLLKADRCEEYEQIICRLFLNLEQLNDGQHDKVDYPQMLKLAARNGYASVVELLLNVIDTEDPDVISTLSLIFGDALVEAAINGHEKVFDCFLRHNVDFNICNRMLIPPLFAAVEKEHIAIVRFLLEHKADINKTDEHGNSVLHIAAKAGNKSVVEMLLQYGAEVNVLNQHKNSPLCAAIMARHEEIVRLLLERRAEVLRENTENLKPLQLAQKLGDKKIIEMVTKFEELQEQTLHGAVTTRNVETLKVLLNNPFIDIDQKNEFGETALFIAVKKGYKVITKLLLNSQADSNIACHDMYPLHEAVKHEGNEPIVELLIQHGAVVNAKLKETNYTPLHCAVQTGEDMVDLLLRHGAEVDVQDFEGRTALMGAAELYKKSVMKVLLDAGADINKQDKSGRTVLHYVIDGNDKRLCAKGLQRSALQWLLDAKADVNKQDGKGNTPMHLAVVHADTKMVSMLFRYHVDIYKKNNVNYTALQCCSEHFESTKHIKSLFQAHAAIMARLTLCMACHERTGPNSPVHQLPKKCVKNIAQHIVPFDFYIKSEEEFKKVNAV